MEKGWQMNRREVIKKSGLFLLGSSLITGNLVIHGCGKKDKSKNITNEDVNILEEISEIILPASDGVGGAKEANVGNYMKVIINDCYQAEEIDKFKDVLKEIEIFSKENYGNSYILLNTNQKEEALINFEHKIKDKQETKYFQLKELIIYVYFSSEIGCTKALRYEAVPGRFVGCVEYKEGDLAWGS